MGPGRSSRSAPINMHYNLAQGVHWKGYPITPLKVPFKMSKCPGQCNTDILQQCKTHSSISCLKTDGTFAFLIIPYFSYLFSPKEANNSLYIFSLIQKWEETPLRIDHKLPCTVLVIYMVMQRWMSQFIISSFSVTLITTVESCEHLLHIQIRLFEWITHSPLHRKGYL